MTARFRGYINAVEVEQVAFGNGITLNPIQETMLMLIEVWSKTNAKRLKKLMDLEQGWNFNFANLYMGQRQGHTILLDAIRNTYPSHVLLLHSQRGGAFNFGLNQDPSLAKNTGRKFFFVDISGAIWSDNSELARIKLWAQQLPNLGVMVL